MQVLWQSFQRQKYFVLPHNDEFVPWLHRQWSTQNVSNDDKVELKELNNLGEKFGKTFLNQSKWTIDDVIEHAIKRVAWPKITKTTILYDTSKTHTSKGERNIWTK